MQTQTQIGPKFGISKKALDGIVSLIKQKIEQILDKNDYRLVLINPALVRLWNSLDAIERLIQKTEGEWITPGHGLFTLLEAMKDINSATYDIEYEIKILERLITAGHKEYNDIKYELEVLVFDIRMKLFDSFLKPIHWG